MKFVKVTSRRRPLSEVVSHLFHPRRSNNHRPRVLHPEAYAVFSLLVAVFALLLNNLTYLPGSLEKVLGVASSITPAQVVDQTNQKRAEAGLAPLTLNGTLSQAALSKAQDMMTDQYWAHTAPDGTQPWDFIRSSGYRYSVAGENLARDFGDTSSMVAAWMASPTHRANILSSRYSEIGIAVVDGNLQGYETTLVVQMFGSPAQVAGTVSPAASSPTPSTQPKAAATQESESAPVQLAQAQETMSEPTTAEQQPTTPDLVTISQAPPASPVAVLASTLVPLGEIDVPPLFAPLHLAKAFFLSVIMMIIATLLYDGFVAGHRNTVRLVGKNLAHVIFLGVVAFLVIFFKGGLVG